MSASEADRQTAHASKYDYLSLSLFLSIACARRWHDARLTAGLSLALSVPLLARDHTPRRTRNAGSDARLVPGPKKLQATHQIWLARLDDPRPEG